MKSEMSNMPLYAKAALLRDLGFRICEIAKALYPGIPAKKAWNRVNRLLHYVNCMNLSNAVYEDDDCMIFSNSKYNANLLNYGNVSVGRLGTLSRKYRKINAINLQDRYLEEILSFVELLYNEIEIYRYDYDRSILVFVKALLKKKRDLVCGEKVHIKNNYIKITPRVAAVIYACFFVALYNLDGSKHLLNRLLSRLAFYLGLRFDDPLALIRSEIKNVMNEFFELIVPSL